MTVFLIFLVTIVVTLLATVFFGRYFTRAAIRAAERSAKDYEPSIGSVCGEDGSHRHIPDVRGGRLDSRTGRDERS